MSLLKSKTTCILIFMGDRRRPSGRGRRDDFILLAVAAGMGARISRCRCIGSMVFMGCRGVSYFYNSIFCRDPRTASVLMIINNNRSISQYLLFSYFNVYIHRQYFLTLDLCTSTGLIQQRNVTRHFYFSLHLPLIV